jgi:uncharacterized protein YuzE
MAVIETIEGTLGAVRFHYDASADVLYLRAASYADANALGEETDDGLIVLRDEASDRVVGVTIVSWWKRFGAGDLPDSLSEFNRHVASAAQRMAA